MILWRLLLRALISHRYILIFRGIFTWFSLLHPISKFITAQAVISVIVEVFHILWQHRKHQTAYCYVMVTRTPGDNYICQFRLSASFSRLFIDCCLHISTTQVHYQWMSWCMLLMRNLTDLCFMIIFHHSNRYICVSIIHTLSWCMKSYCFLLQTRRNIFWKA